MYGPGCLQNHNNPDVPHPQSEDCLNLNVYTPASTCSTPLPAMIWFHGGSFEEGGSSLFYYNATNLALSQCVVVVTGNYRLGAFGSLFLPVRRPLTPISTNSTEIPFQSLTLLRASTATRTCATSAS